MIVCSFELMVWLDITALVGGDPAGALAMLQRGVASAEHGELLARLEARRTP